MSYLRLDTCQLEEEFSVGFYIVTHSASIIFGISRSFASFFFTETIHNFDETYINIFYCGVEEGLLSFLCKALLMNNNDLKDRNYSKLDV